MWLPIVNLGPVSITVFGLSLVTIFILGSFIFWKGLRDDYDEESLLTVWLWLVVMAWLGSGVWMWWTGAWRQVWGAFLLPLLFLVYWSAKKKWDFWQIWDVAGPVSLAAIILGSIGWGSQTWQWSWVAAVGLVVSAVIRRLYRRWRWYKSGRPGLVGLWTLVVWGGVNLMVANFSWWAVYSLAGIVLATLMLGYIRSGRQIVWLRRKNLKP